MPWRFRSGTVCVLRQDSQKNLEKALSPRLTPLASQSGRNRFSRPCSSPSPPPAKRKRREKTANRAIIFSDGFSHGGNDTRPWNRISGPRRQQPERCDERHSAAILGLTFQTLKASISGRPVFVPKLTVCETGRGLLLGPCGRSAWGFLHSIDQSAIVNAGGTHRGGPQYLVSRLNR
jgi:hypothetical protein